MFAQKALVAETGRLQKFAYRLTKNRADAEDLLQSTCLRALEKAEYFDDDSNLFSWTSKIMFNLFASNYRRRKKFETRYDPEIFIEKLASAPVQETNIELAHVKRAMMQLSSDHRRVLILVCVNGGDYADVARMLCVPVGTVKSRLSRARLQFGAILKDSRNTSSGGISTGLRRSNH